MLYLLVRLGSDAYAIEAKIVRRIVPFARLKSLPSSLAEIAGVLNYHGRAVPVIDLTLLLTRAPSREQLATRIILADVDLPGAAPCLLGLLVEGAHAVAQLDPAGFQPAGVRPDGTAWLGPVIDHDRQLVQRLEIAQIFPPGLVAALLRDAENSLAA